MTIRINNITLFCDGRGCSRRGGGHTAKTYAFLKEGEIQVHIPNGWKQDAEGHMGCPACVEYETMKRLIQTDTPNPIHDSEEVREHREFQKKNMREMVREVLDEEKATAATRNRLHCLSASDAKSVPLSQWDDGLSKPVTSGTKGEPDFFGQVGESEKKIEVRVCGAGVEISDPAVDGMTLTLKHHRYLLRDVPYFVDPEIVYCVQQGLLVMANESEE